jgi:hypothetical protein
VPWRKLSQKHAEKCAKEKTVKGIAGQDDLLKASFIAGGQEKSLWIECAPEEGEGNPIAALKDASSECRQKLLSAISRRLLSLYRHWYDELKIERVFGGPNA